MARPRQRVLCLGVAGCLAGLLVMINSLDQAAGASGRSAASLARAVVGVYRTSVAGTVTKLTGDIYLCVKGATDSTIMGLPSVLDPAHRSCYRKAHQRDTSLLSGGAELALDEVTTAPGLPSLEFLSRRASVTSSLSTYTRLSTAACWTRVLRGGGTLPDRFVDYRGEHLSILSRSANAVELQGTADHPGGVRMVERDRINVASDLISQIDSVVVGPGANRLRLVEHLHALRTPPTLPSPSPLCPS